MVFNFRSLGMGLLLAASSYGQTPSKSSAKVCALVPAAELEAHFGAKATSIRGNDTNTASMCAVDIPDHRHGADLMTNATATGSLTVEQRLAVLRKTLEREGAQVKNFGSVGCFTGKVDMGTAKLPTATCFLEKAGYISLSLRSDDVKQLSFEDVKALLEKAAARRK